MDFLDVLAPEGIEHEVVVMSDRLEVVVLVVDETSAPKLFTRCQPVDITGVNQSRSFAEPPRTTTPLVVAGRRFTLVDAIAARWGTETSPPNVQIVRA